MAAHNVCVCMCVCMCVYVCVCVYFSHRLSRSAEHHKRNNQSPRELQLFTADPLPVRQRNQVHRRTDEQNPDMQRDRILERIGRIVQMLVQYVSVFFSVIFSFSRYQRQRNL